MDNFRVALYRRYPQLCAAAEHLVALYNEIPDKSDLEIEGFYGHLDGTRFRNDLSLEIFHTIAGMLDQCNAWLVIKDWYQVHDYYLDGQERLRVTYEDDYKKCERVRKQSLSKCDLVYGQPVDQWQLSEYLTRITFKREVQLPETLELRSFKSFKLSMRKVYIKRSTIGQLIWRFELIKYWIGASLEEVERQVKAGQEPKYTFECEVDNLPTDMTDEQLYTLFASLLLKMEDFLSFPISKEMVLEQTLAPYLESPTFLVV